MSIWIQYNWQKVLATLFALGALAPIPYFAYYQLMNWVVVGAAVMTAAHAFKQNKMWIFWIFVLLAVVFNPIAPLYLATQVWRVADIVAAALFVVSFYYIRVPETA